MKFCNRSLATRMLMKYQPGLTLYSKLCMTSVGSFDLMVGVGSALLDELVLP